MIQAKNHPGTYVKLFSKGEVNRFSSYYNLKLQTKNLLHFTLLDVE